MPNLWSRCGWRFSNNLEFVSSESIARARSALRGVDLKECSKYSRGDDLLVDDEAVFLVACALIEKKVE